MKRYTTGLITGILLTASAVMFMGSVQNNQNGRYVEYSSMVFTAFSIVEEAMVFSGLDTKSGDVIANIVGDNLQTELQFKHNLVSGKTTGRVIVDGEWSEWADPYNRWIVKD